VREVYAPPRFALRRRVPPEVLEARRSRRGARLGAGRLARRVDLARDRFGLRHAIHRVGERPVARVAEGQGGGADRRGDHPCGIESGCVERGSRRAKDRPGVGVGGGPAGIGHHQPHSASVRAVREPGDEKNRALVRDVHAPSRFAFRGGAPPQALHVDIGRRGRDGSRGAGEVGGAVGSRASRTVEGAHAVRG
jgi:hypothetical protein